MGLFGKLFEKKECSICGGDIGLLGNRKLEDGNCCKNCAAKLSPWFSERRQSTVEDIKAQLEYREANQEKVEAFHATRTLGEGTKVILDEDAGKFVVTSARNWQSANPDVLAFSDVTGCTLDIDESRTEIEYKDKEGNRQSFTPKRYAYSYDFYIVIHVNNPYFNEIRFKLNSSSVDNDEETLLDGPQAMPRSRSGASRPMPGGARPGAVRPVPGGARPGAVRPAPGGARPMPGRAPMGGGMMGGGMMGGGRGPHRHRHRGLSLGPGEGQLAAGILDVLFAHGNRPILDIQVIPEESYQLTLPQAAHQLQIEHGQNAPCVGGVQVGLQMLRPEGFHFHLLNLWGNAVIGGVAGDEPLLHCPLKRAVEHQVDAAHRGAAQAGVAVAAFRVDSAMLHQIFVHLLEVSGGQLFQLDLPDAGDGIGFDHQLVAVCCGLPYIGLGVEVVPGVQPGGHGVFIRAGDVYLLGLLYRGL